MEKEIKNYEDFIKTKTANMKSMPREYVESLSEYHDSMVKNFQHERLVHEIVMFFFIAVTLVLLPLFAIYYCENSLYNFNFNSSTAPFSLCFAALTLIMVILSAAYVKHYYFLENHVQGLYKYSEKIIKRLIDNK